jgi:hypothetical protein
MVRYIPGVTVLGYPAGRNTAEIACCRACEGFSVNRRVLERPSMSRESCCKSYDMEETVMACHYCTC